MPFVCKTDGNAIVIKCPQLLNEPIVQFLRPLASKKGDNLCSSVHKLRPISPSRVGCISERYFLRITRIPTVLSQVNLLNRGLAGEWWHGWAGRHGFSLLCCIRLRSTRSGRHDVSEPNATEQSSPPVRVTRTRVPLWHFFPL